MEFINTEIGKLHNEMLFDFELVNSIKLPEDYKEFLLQYNGGKPTKQLHLESRTVVKYFFGMHNGAFFESIPPHIDMLNVEGRVPHGTFAIASDPFGNFFLLAVDETDYGEIFFWEHENETTEPDGSYVNNCYRIAYSFSDFINGLVDLEENL